MKAKATERFVDRVAGIIREEGEVFECDKARLDTLLSAGYVVAVSEQKKSARKATK